MINIPRQLIYRDRTNLSDYLAYNELNKAIYVALQSVHPGSWLGRLFNPSALSDKEILSMFNDAYYLCIVAANDPDFRKEDYTHPNGRHAHDVWQMVMVILSLQEETSRYPHIPRLLEEEIHPPFRGVLRRFESKGQAFPMKLELHVPCADTLEMDWEAATRGFKKRIILGILGLWTNPEDKLIICGQIRDAFLASPRRDMLHMEVDGRFFEEQMQILNLAAEQDWEQSMQKQGLWNWYLDCPPHEWEDRRRAMMDEHTGEDEPQQPAEPQPEEEAEAASIEEDPSAMEEAPIVIEKEKKKKSIFVNSRGEENLARRAEEAGRFLKYIRSKEIDTDKLVIDTSAKNFVNLAFVAFFREWSLRGWVLENGWVACYRFLHYDCGFSFSVQKKVYATFIGKMAGYEYDIEDELQKIIPEVKACFQTGASAGS